MSTVSLPYGSVAYTLGTGTHMLPTGEARRGQVRDRYGAGVRPVVRGSRGVRCEGDTRPQGDGRPRRSPPAGARAARARTGREHDAGRAYCVSPSRTVSRFGQVLAMRPY